jgi:hypothetical protein
MLGSVNPYLCPNLGVCVHCAEARISDRTIIVLLKFDGRGVAFSIVLEFLCFASKHDVLVLGSKFLLILN